MKRIIYISLLFTILSMSSYGQGEVSDYLVVVIEFTENQQHLEAVKFCDKLTKKFPDNPDVFFLRGVNQYLLNEYDTAIEDFDTTLMLKSDYPDALLYRAKARKASKDYFGAMKDYNKAKDQNFSQTVTSLAGDVIRSLFTGKK